MQTEFEKFEQDLLTVDEDWREIFKTALTSIEQLKLEIFDPPQAWNKWQETKNYKIEVSEHFQLYLFIDETILSWVISLSLKRFSKHNYWQPFS